MRGSLVLIEDYHVQVAPGHRYAFTYYLNYRAEMEKIQCRGSSGKNPNHQHPTDYPNDYSWEFFCDCQYNKGFNVDIMKRAKSVLSMRNLAASIKQSIQLDAEKQLNFQPSRTSKSVTALIPHRYSETPVPGQHHQVTQQQKEDRILVIQKQIATLEKELSSTARDGKGYDSDLALYDDITKRLEQSQKAMAVQRAGVEQIKNQILMLQEEIHSIQFNIQENMAQKEYHQELIETYGHQYQAESKIVFTIVQLQAKNQTIKGEIKSLQQTKEKAEGELSEWKAEIEFDLNEHKLKNSLKIIRMKLIHIEDQCDTFCAQHQLRKIRQLYCLYFKNYANANGVANQQAEDGLDIFVCKRALSEDFCEFVRERLVYNKPKFPLLEEYLSSLTEMEQVFRKSIFEANRKIHTLLLSDIQELNTAKEEKLRQIQVNEARVKQLADQIDDLFNNDSIAVIEYMRQKNRNKYDLKEIKGKLRQNKKEQKHRITKIRSSFHKITELERILEKTTYTLATETNRTAIEELAQTLIQAELRQQQLEIRFQRQKKEKETVQDRISSQITRWRHADEKKEKLKVLYQELQAAKRLEAEQGQRYKITKNLQSISKDHSRTSLGIKQNNNADPSFDLKQHSKNTSISSLNQSRSVLSLSNPFKKALERSVKDTYQPILSNCQLILSRKLTHKDLEINDLESRPSSNILKDKNQDMNSTISKKKNAASVYQGINKSIQNDIWSKNKSLAITPFKKPVPTSLNSKGKICLSQRQSLSKLLISKFHR